MAAGDAKEAFMAAHTLKGVSQNLGFDNLYEPAVVGDRGAARRRCR